MEAPVLLVSVIVISLAPNPVMAALKVRVIVEAAASWLTSAALAASQLSTSVIAKLESAKL
jgi:hypothetical protein